MKPDYEGLVEYMKGKGSIPLVVIYGKEANGGVDLDFLTTPAYDDADATLKGDIKSTVKRVAEALNG